MDARKNPHVKFRLCLHRPEFSLTTADTRRGRLDLFLIDPGNKIIVTIENKAGASLTETQLSDYYAAVSQQISNRRVSPIISSPISSSTATSRTIPKSI